MKKLIASAAALVMMAGIASAEPLLGTWQTTKDDNGNYGHIQVKDCGGAICGTLVKSFDGAGKTLQTENTGKTIISETVAKGGGEYRGKIYSPDRDKTYSSKLILNGNSLSVSGCVFGICRDGGTWTRVN